MNCILENRSNVSERNKEEVLVQSQLVRISKLWNQGRTLFLANHHSEKLWLKNGSLAPGL